LTVEDTPAQPWRHTKILELGGVLSGTKRSYARQLTVRGAKESFIVGAIAHCHEPKIGLLPACKVKAAVQQKTRDNPFQPASKIVEVYLSVIPPNAITECIPEHAYLMRTANRRREKARPKNPETFDFTLDNKFIPDSFVKADI
jgi:hypothetical protein